MKKKEKETTEEIVYDNSDSPETGSPDLKKKLDKIKKELKKCQEEKRTYLDGWQRSKADFINFKKRSEESKRELAKYAAESIIIEILPVVDNFEQAFKNKEIWERVDENWRKGVEMLYNQLLEILKNNNVTEIDVINENFDPQIHECVEIIEVEDKNSDDKILEVIQKGYRIGNKIIKHPNVKVGRIKK